MVVIQYKNFSLSVSTVASQQTVKGSQSQRNGVITTILIASIV